MTNAANTANTANTVDVTDVADAELITDVTDASDVTGPTDVADATDVTDVKRADALFAVRDLHVEFNTKRGALAAVDGISFDIKKGETVCLVGESGSGKSVTARSIIRLIQYENGAIKSGSVTLDENDLTALSIKEMYNIRGKKVALVFQEPMSAFDPVVPIGKQIAETIIKHGLGTREQARDKALELLKRVGIPEPEIRMKQYPHEMSGGMLQRMMIAMALSCGPELLIADEPTTALDVTIQSQILRLLQELKEEFGMSILLITHDMGIAAKMADRIFVMYAGKIVEQARGEQLFARPYHPYTWGLLHSIVDINSDRTVRLHSIKGSIPSLYEIPSGCRFHPRCPSANERCRLEEPLIHEMDGRLVACWSAGVEMSYESFEGFTLDSDSASNPVPDSEERYDRGAADGDTGFANMSSYESYEGLTLFPPSRGRRRKPAKAVGPNGLIQPGANGADAAGATGSVGVAGSAPEKRLFVIQNLSKFYPIHKNPFSRVRKNIRAVDGVSFFINRGETFGLVGESGSGKSTLGRVLLRLETPTQGEILFNGQDLASVSSGDLRRSRRHMQVIFQDPYNSMNPRMRIGDIIGEPLSVHETLNSAERKERVAALLDTVGVDSKLHEKFPHEFSGGQRQRISIARAIALNPQFVLADEAVSALDVSVQAQIINLLQDLQKKLGLTYLFIAHSLNVVRHLSDRIGVMYLGKMVELSTSEELFNHPAHPYTKGLIASIPSMDPARKKEWLTIAGEIPSPANPPSGCYFHPRCPFATAQCREEAPPLGEINAAHWTACHHPQ